MSSRRVRKVLPVPLLPKTPLLRLTSSSTSMQSFDSMSMGLPIQNLRSLGAPKTVSMSASVAADTVEKWAGTVLAGEGPSSPSTASAPPMASMGSTFRAP